MDRGERTALVLAIVMAALVVWGIASGAAAFSFFPAMDAVFTPASVALAAGAFAALVLAALALRAPWGVGRPSGS
jgi:hypothetical protein